MIYMGPVGIEGGIACSTFPILARVHFLKTFGGESKPTLAVIRETFLGTCCVVFSLPIQDFFTIFE